VYRLRGAPFSGPWFFSCILLIFFSSGPAAALICTHTHLVSCAVIREEGSQEGCHLLGGGEFNEWQDGRAPHRIAKHGEVSGEFCAPKGCLGNEQGARLIRGWPNIWSRTHTLYAPDHAGSSLLYNEFIVYDVAQVNLRSGHAVSLNETTCK